MRMGKKKQPTYRVVAADSRSPRDGRFLEVVGTYAPRGRSTADDETIVSIDHEKALRWLRQGAKPTDRVERLLRTSGTLDRLAGGSGETAPTAPVASATAPPAAGATEADSGVGGDGGSEDAGDAGTTGGADSVDA